MNYVCFRCSLRRAGIAIRTWKPPSQKRSITQNHLRKKAEAEAQWMVQAADIKAGRKKAMLDILEERGYIHSVTGDRKALNNLMTHKRVGAYVGIDPTAPALHVGHLLPLMSLFWLFIHGFHAVTLLGGATAQIGDPTDRTTSRESVPSSIRKANMATMHMGLKKLWLNVEMHARKYGYKWEWAWHRELVNNNAWINKLPMIEVLKVLGSGARIGTMLGRDTVKNKLEKGDGMSFAEFSYPVLQSWDWWHMYQTKGIQLQIGGSDQYGNIVAGIDAIKYILKNHYDPLIRQEKEDRMRVPMGFTTPLLTSASGEKFGKSAGNAIWLDQDMTSTFDLYQHFLRLADNDVERYLKLFTFMPLPQIKEIMDEHVKDPSKRHAQHALARDVIEMVHGAEEATKVEASHRMLFGARTGQEKPAPTGGDLSNSLNENAPQTNSSNAPSVHVVLPQSLVLHQSIARVLYAAGLVSSKSEGHRLAANQGAYIGSRADGTGRMSDDLTFTPVKLFAPYRTKDFIIDGDLLILRVGKWKLKVIKIVSDEEFVRRGLDAPGWQEVQEEAKEKADEEGVIGSVLEDRIQTENGSVREDMIEPKGNFPEDKKILQRWSFQEGTFRPKGNFSGDGTRTQRENFQEDTIRPKGNSPEERLQPKRRNFRKDSIRPKGNFSEDRTQPQRESFQEDTIGPKGNSPEDRFQPKRGSFREDRTRSKRGIYPEDKFQPKRGRIRPDRSQRIKGSFHEDGFQHKEGTDQEYRMRGKHVGW